MIPINSAYQFESFLRELKVYTQSIAGSYYDYLGFKLYAKFPNQHNSVMDYRFSESNTVSSDTGRVCYEYIPYLEGRLVPYYIEESIPLEINGKVITKEKNILTFVPFDQVKYYGVELTGYEQEFLEWRKSKAASESE